MSGYTEAEKSLLASLLMMEVMGLQVANEERKVYGDKLKYDEEDFFASLRNAEDKLRRYI
ncbi:hypothetical protein [Bacillus massiliigorillae]|uniref:hypothetical protein n=1 Tax=Bacillus massiliigorillae TaxID=1243664 RepID=UPI0003A67BA3|nr:hypothetical protein [Bacillus massiliigorillae]